MTTVLIAGSTGMLGSLIAGHLLDLGDTGGERAAVRLLLRDSSPADPDKAAIIDDLVARGAATVIGDVTDPETLADAVTDVDVVVSALQGGEDIILHGQVALAEAAAHAGVRRFIASDFALDLFKAPVGAPQFDLRRAADDAIDRMDLEVVHILNGAFMDMMLDPKTAGIVDLSAGTARLWGTGDEPFNLTTVDDTARFTARIATDPADLGGVRMVSGSETTFNTIIAKTEELTGRTFTRNVMGDVDDLRRITSEAENPWSVIMQWYFLSMITVPPFPSTENDRYPDLTLTSLDDYLTEAHRSTATA
jgi:nucleoside-diphosphate-sugar epimerase